jgi:hypothetical protein
MLKPHGPQDSATELELRELARAYRAVEMSADAAIAMDTDDEALHDDRSLPAFLRLVAEAQSALLTGLRSCQVGRDLDQRDLWCWVRQATDRHRIFLDRYMSLEHAAHPRDLIDFPDRLGELVDQVQARREREKRRLARIRRIEYHVKSIEEALSRGMESEDSSLAHDWNKVTETVTDWVSDGDHVTDERLLGALAKVASEVPDALLVGHVAKVLEAVERWLGARSAQTDDEGQEVDDAAAADETVGSVGQACERVLGRYPDRIVLALNNRSDPDYDYARPAEVEQALEWLATVLWESRGRPGTGKDHRALNYDLMKRCGWFYRPTQSASTMGRFPDWYRCSLEGRTFSLAEHVGRGNTKRQGRNSIRIAFAWDAEASRVVVGFLGQHQRTAQT